MAVRELVRSADGFRRGSLQRRDLATAPTFFAQIPKSYIVANLIGTVSNRSDIAVFSDAARNDILPDAFGF